MFVLGKTGSTVRAGLALERLLDKTDGNVSRSGIGRRA
jgi:hypothetical protein